MWGLLRSLFAATPPHPESVSEPPAEFGVMAAPDWMLEWTGWVRPYGGGYRGRLSLWEEAGPVSLQVEYPVSRTRSAGPRSVRLSESAERRLRSVLRDAFPEECFDGFPFEVTVHRREPYRGVRARCNLGDALELIRPWGGPPGQSWVEQMDAVVEAGRTLAPVFRLGFVLFEVSVGAREPT